MNIKFKKDGVVKETHEKFTDALIEAGWEVVKVKVDVKPKKATKKAKK
jgi:hypothetical protein